MGNFSTAAANAMLDTELATVYCKLHTGDPGSAGTSNAATNTTRQLLTMSAAAAGVKTQSANISWTSVPASETYSWLSFWTTVGPAGGTFLGKDDLSSPSAVSIGNTFTINTLSITFTLATVV